MDLKGIQSGMPKRGRQDSETGITWAVRQGQRPRTQRQRQQGRKKSRRPRIPRAGVRGEATPVSPARLQPSRRDQTERRDPARVSSGRALPVPPPRAPRDTVADPRHDGTGGVRPPARSIGMVPAVALRSPRPLELRRPVPNALTPPPRPGPRARSRSPPGSAAPSPCPEQKRRPGPRRAEAAWGPDRPRRRWGPRRRGSIREGFLEARSPEDKTSTPSRRSLVCSIGPLFSFLR